MKLPILQTSLVKAFATYCPKCEHFLAIGVEELRVGRGKAQCGKCSTVFDAVAPGFVEMGNAKRQLIAVCPKCATAEAQGHNPVRVLTADQLLPGQGNIRCSDCSTLFNACASIYEQPSPGGSLNIDVDYDAMTATIPDDTSPFPRCAKCGYTHEPGAFCVVRGSISSGDSPSPAPSAAAESLAGTRGPVGSGTRQSSAGGFELAGRPALERFFREHVIDIIESPARYKAFGVNFPGAIVLHGPPGCGKTFAVDKLIEYLGWPSYRMEASNIGSPFIHETSMKVAAIFDEAIKNAPSVIVIDEMDAFLPKRQTAAGSGQHAVEEVAEFLRRIPEANKRRVLIVGMTNQIDLIDAAILRRGRFDHVIEVPMATEIEIVALLKKLLTGLPVEPGVKIGAIAGRLCGRPLSDVSFVVKEAARLAALHRQSTVSEAMLTLALQRTVGA